MRNTRGFNKEVILMIVELIHSNLVDEFNQYSKEEGSLSARQQGHVTHDIRKGVAQVCVEDNVFFI